MHTSTHHGRIHKNQQWIMTVVIVAVLILAALMFNANRPSILSSSEAGVGDGRADATMGGNQGGPASGIGY